MISWAESTARKLKKGTYPVFYSLKTARQNKKGQIEYWKLQGENITVHSLDFVKKEVQKMTIPLDAVKYFAVKSVFRNILELNIVGKDHLFNIYTLRSNKDSVEKWNTALKKRIPHAEYIVDSKVDLRLTQAAAISIGFAIAVLGVRVFQATQRMQSVGYTSIGSVASVLVLGSLVAAFALAIKFRKQVVQALM